MRQWYVLKRGQGLEQGELLAMTAEERKWWIEQIQKENEALKNSLPGKMKG